MENPNEDQDQMAATSATLTGSTELSVPVEDKHVEFSELFNAATASGSNERASVLADDVIASLAHSVIGDINCELDAEIRQPPVSSQHQPSTNEDLMSNQQAQDVVKTSQCYCHICMEDVQVDECCNRTTCKDCLNASELNPTNCNYFERQGTVDQSGFPAASMLSSKQASSNDDLSDTWQNYPLQTFLYHLKGITETQVGRRTTERVKTGQPSLCTRLKDLQDKLNAVENAAFLVDDINILEEALIRVEAVHDMLKKNCPTNHGLRLKNSLARKESKPNQVEYYQVFDDKKLPEWRKWKERTSTPVVLPDKKLEGPRKMMSEQSEGVIVDLNLSSDDSDQDKETENTISEESKQATNSTRNNTFGGPQRIWRCDPVTRLLNAKRVHLEMNQDMLTIGPFKLTVGDLWTLVSPDEAKKHASETRFIEGFVSGWLVDKIVDAVLWKLAQQYNSLFCAHSSFAEIVKWESSMCSLWSERSFSEVTRIFFPILKSRSHWTLLVLDKLAETRYYFDPVAGDVRRVISSETNHSLASLLNKISEIADTETDWDSRSWRCMEPVHFKQKDNFNCGIIVCLFARCLCEGSSVEADFNLETERARITDMLFGCCYDDIHERNINICKVCRDDDGEDWQRCNSCGQYFHKSCIKVDFSETHANNFVCPCQ